MLDGCWRRRSPRNRGVGELSSMSRGCNIRFVVLAPPSIPTYYLFWCEIRPDLTPTATASSRVASPNDMRLEPRETGFPTDAVAVVPSPVYPVEDTGLT